MNFITVKESHYQQDLVILKSRLESEGIECRLKNEFTTQILNHIPAFLVELQVKETDYEKVRQILIENGELQPGSEKAVCPKCGSSKTRLKLSFAKRVKLYFSVMYVFLGSNLPMDKLFKRTKLYCPDCDHEFY